MRLIEQKSNHQYILFLTVKKNLYIMADQLEDFHKSIKCKESWDWLKFCKVLEVEPTFGRHVEAVIITDGH